MFETDFQFYNHKHVNKLQTYIEENFILDNAAKHLVQNILKHVASINEPPVQSLHLLMFLLDGLGITVEEIVNAVTDKQKEG